MTAHATPSRRDMIKGGALIVGFNFAAPMTSALLPPLAMPATAATPDPAMLDSWIAVHADSTATVFMGKVELGQGTTTGMLQIAGRGRGADAGGASVIPPDATASAAIKGPPPRCRHGGEWRQYQGRRSAARPSTAGAMASGARITLGELGEAISGSACRPDTRRRSDAADHR